MPELTCPECSSPIDLPVIASSYFVSCETCCAQIEMPFALEGRAPVSPSEPTPEPTHTLRFPHCSEQIPSRVNRAATEEGARPKADSAAAIMIAVIAAVVGASMVMFGLWRMLA